MKFLFRHNLQQSCKVLNKRFFSEEKSDSKNYHGISKMFLFAGMSSAFFYVGWQCYKTIQMEKEKQKQIWEEYYKEIEKFEELRLKRHLEWNKTDPENYSMEKYLEEVREGERIMEKTGVRPRK